MFQEKGVLNTLQVMSFRKTRWFYDGWHSYLVYLYFLKVWEPTIIDGKIWWVNKDKWMFIRDSRSLSFHSNLTVEVFVSINLIRTLTSREDISTRKRMEVTSCYIHGAFESRRIASHVIMYIIHKKRQLDIRSTSQLLHGSLQGNNIFI